jgi:hypothetical protein
MPRPEQKIGTFMKKFGSLEAKTELLMSIALYVMLSLVVMTLVDKYVDVVFDNVEQWLPFINPMGKTWIFAQVTIQFFVSIVAFFLIRNVVNSLVYTIGKQGPGFGMFGDFKVGTVIFAFVMFFSQANLKEKMKLLVPKF